MAGEPGSGPDGDKSGRAARRRSIAIALLLALMVGLFYAATIVRLGSNVVNRGM
ncbi:MAG: protein CoxF [Hyphomicrobium sp.]